MKIKFLSVTFGIFLSLSLLPLGCVHAQESQILSVTPPLFRLSAEPGGIWQSSVKVVNGNAYPLTVYTEVVNFVGMGTGGQGRFIPIPKEGADNATLAEWITVQDGPHTIPPEQTVDITFFAEVPENAAPGGHYAAILVSTEEPKSSEGFSVAASQAVTSLLFLRVEGEVEEQGVIREFRTEDSFLDTPDATFLLRFENKGNVHILPRGDITITNMWGTERGKIPINTKADYGFVLPKSIREYVYSWKSDFNFADIGRYKAVATLGYGEDGVKNVSSITYFWVIPVKWTLITLSVLALFIWLIVAMVRAYVRRMLALAGVHPEEERSSEKQSGGDVYMGRRNRTYRTVSAPIRSGVIDLRSRLESSPKDGVLDVIVQFILTYKWFFLSLMTLIVMFVSISLYVGTATRNDAEFEVRVHENDGTTTLLEETATE